MPSSSLLVVGAGFGRHDEGRVGQPVEVVEPAVQVAAEVGRRAFVAEELPHERLVVERDDRGRLQELEERRALGLGQRLELRVGVELGERARAVEPRDALLDLPRDGLVAVGRRLDLADDRLVGLVGEAVVAEHRAGGAQGGLPRAVGELVVHVLPLSSEDRAPPIRSPATSGPTLSDPLCGVKHVGNRCPTAGARGPFRATGEAPAPGGYGAVRAMLLLLAFAFLAGAGTALSPCVLPVLPAVLSAGGAGGRRRPLGVVLGLAATFTITIVGVAEVVGGVGLGTDPLRALAVFVLAGFGIALLFPSVAARLEAPLARLSRYGPRSRGDGFWSGVLVGAALGLVYTPCAGPVLAAVITVSAATGRSVAVAIAYATGSAAVLLVLCLGGRRVLERVRAAGRGPVVQRALGAVMLLTAVAIVANVDVSFDQLVAREIPQVSLTASLERSDAVARRLRTLHDRSPRFATPVPAGIPAGADGLPKLGRAPEFTNTQRWFNTIGGRPESLRSLRGRVVLVDFWTYTCINCLRTLPYLEAWDRRYRDAGLTIVGVHTPEFAFEHDAGNVSRAVGRLE